MTVSPTRATMPPSTVGSTMTLTSTCLPVACDSAAAQTRPLLARRAGPRCAPRPPRAGARPRPARRSGRRSPGRSLRATDADDERHQRRRDRERLAAQELLDHRHAAAPPGSDGSVSASRSSSLPSNARAKRKSSSSTSPSVPSARATSRRASAYASMRSLGLGHCLPAPHLVDVALDERDLGVAVEVALDDLLGQLDRQLGDPALQVGDGPLGREPDVLLRPGRSSAASASACAIRSLRTWSAAWRASSMIVPASLRASASWRWYSAELGLGLGLRPPRPPRGPPGSCPRGRPSPS